MEEFYGIPRHPRVNDICILHMYCDIKHPLKKRGKASFFCHKESTNIWEVKPISVIKEGEIIFWNLRRNVELVALEAVNSRHSWSDTYYCELKVKIISIIKSKKEK